MVDVGQKGPDFIAPAVQDGSATELELFRLVDRSDAVVLCVYPADFVPTCTAELAAIRDADWDAEPGLEIVGISGDSLFAHFAYADRFDLPFPLVSDFHGSIADSYDLLADDWEAHSEIPRRATVVIDGDWTVPFLEATRDANDRPSPAPVENATDAVRELGIDVERPQVDYEGPW